MNWVLINKLVDATGYTNNAIRAKIKKGVWQEGRHFRKAPDGRLFFNLKEIQRWVEGKVA